MLTDNLPEIKFKSTVKQNIKIKQGNRFKIAISQAFLRFRIVTILQSNKND